MQPTSRVVVGGFEVAKTSSNSSEPPDVFCGLASLIVEGRVPKTDGRGYGEGPHAPQTANKSLSLRHECSDENNMVRTCYFWRENSKYLKSGQLICLSN